MDVLQTLVCDVTGIRHSVFITHQTSLGEVSGLFASRFFLSGVAPVRSARMVIVTPQLFSPQRATGPERSVLEVVRDYWYPLSPRRFLARRPEGPGQFHPRS
jgi:hypothetical protein